METPSPEARSPVGSPAVSPGVYRCVSSAPSAAAAEAAAAPDDVASPAFAQKSPTEAAAAPPPGGGSRGTPSAAASRAAATMARQDGDHDSPPSRPGTAAVQPLQLDAASDGQAGAAPWCQGPEQRSGWPPPWRPSQGKPFFPILGNFAAQQTAPSRFAIGPAVM